MALRDTASLLAGLLVLFHTWGAWAVVEVNMEDKVEVLQGQTARITCIFTSDDGIGATTMEWHYVISSRQKQRIYHQSSLMTVVDQSTPYTDRISVNVTRASKEIVLTISNVQVEDEVEFVCLITTLTDGIGEGRTKLRVFEAPNPPTIESVRTGISVNERHPSKIGVCEVKNGYPKPNITWYRNLTPLRNIPDELSVLSLITRESSGLYSVTSELRMKVVKEDEDADFYCEVTFFLPGATSMTETTRINVTVYYPATAVNIWVESPKGKIKEGDTIELHCRGNGNPLSSIFSIKRPKEDEGKEKSIMVLDDVTRLDSGVYVCTSTDMETFEGISSNTTVFVNYLDSAVVTPQGTIEVAQGEELKATCNALSSLHTETVWLKDGEEFSKGNTLIVKNATFDTAGAYVCVVTVPEIEGMESSSTLHAYVKGRPEITEKDSTEIESYEKTVDLSCRARGFPVPEIIWTTSDGKVHNEASQTKTEDDVVSELTVKVASDMTAVCSATNKYGADTLTFNIKAIKTTTAIQPEKVKKENNGVIIAVIIICILLLAILGSVLYFLYKKGKICGRSGKQDLTKEKSNKDNIVVEMKSDNTEEAILLGVNGEKQPPSDQGGEYLNVQK
ncbi:melanoma cell adhesion molecule b isoform X4 [Brachyistius frenatus]|uniref:melanoma cell adhesion molecule b isoform X4 n=1 Tax=Brachyistius frenatus TaxID=100188 RepID=UPI0037E937A3